MNVHLRIAPHGRLLFALATYSDLRGVVTMVWLGTRSYPLRWA